jgi:hypothetical protein
MNIGSIVTTRTLKDRVNDETENDQPLEPGLKGEGPMSYESAMEAAGAEILASQAFGSYQGDMWCRVRYAGEEGWVCIGYGSCSGCDSYEAEFGYGDEHDHPDGATYVGLHSQEFSPATCAKCAELQARLVDFGKRYVDGCLMSQADAEAQATRNIEWDSEAGDVLVFLRANPVATPVTP